MKKSIMFILIAIVLIIVSCGNKDADDGKAPDQQDDDQAPVMDDQLSNGGSAADDTAPEPSNKADPKIQALFDKAKKATNFYTSRNTLHEKPLVVEIYVKDDLQKYTLFDESRYVMDENFDVVYVDTKAKTATGYCEGLRTTICPDKDKKFVLDYNEIYTKNPIEWFLEFDPLDLTIVSSETIEQRKAQVLKGTYQGQEAKLWVDEYSGIPIRIELGSGAPEDKEVFIYANIGIRSVKDSDVKRP